MIAVVKMSPSMRKTTTFESFAKFAFLSPFDRCLYKWRTWYLNQALYDQFSIKNVPSHPLTCHQFSYVLTGYLDVTLEGLKVIRQKAIGLAVIKMGLYSLQNVH